MSLDVQMYELRIKYAPILFSLSKVCKKNTGQSHDFFSNKYI